ncbi:MAG: peptidoglycan DL-endopeptidase CwlO [Mycobacteriales bacterium]
MLFIGLAGGSGQAAPAAPPARPHTAAQALAQLKAFNEQFEKVTEQYNDARVLLKRRTAEARLASRKAALAQKQVTALAGQVHHVVTSAYSSVPLSQIGVMLTSGSPQQFLEQISALNALAGRRATLLAKANQVKTAAVKSVADAKAAVTAANKLATDLAARRADLSRRAAESKRLFTSLSAQERQAFLAQQGDSTERGSRGSPRETGGGTASSPPPPPPPVNVPASGRAAVAVATARAQVGKPYVWATAGPSTYDCSGLTMYSWAAAGIVLPHSSSMQINVGSRVSRSQLQPGDLVYFYSPIHHVGIYIGNGMMIHAPTENDVVKYASIDNMPFSGASRPG